MWDVTRRHLRSPAWHPAAEPDHRVAPTPRGSRGDRHRRRSARVSPNEFASRNVYSPREVERPAADDGAAGALRLAGRPGPLPTTGALPGSAAAQLLGLNHALLLVGELPRPVQVDGDLVGAGALAEGDGQRLGEQPGAQVTRGDPSVRAAGAEGPLLPVKVTSTPLPVTRMPAGRVDWPAIGCTPMLPSPVTAPAGPVMVPTPGTSTRIGSAARTVTVTRLPTGLGDGDDETRPGFAGWRPSALRSRGATISGALRPRL